MIIFWIFYFISGAILVLFCGATNEKDYRKILCCFFFGFLTLPLGIILAIGEQFGKKKKS